MIKSITFLRRKPGLSHEQFCQYWNREHASLFVRIVPGLRRYVQNVPIRVSGSQEGDEIDGIAETWYDDLDAINAMLEWRKSEAGKALTADEEKFIDKNKTVTRYLVQENVIK